MKGLNVLLSSGKGDRDWLEIALKGMPIDLMICITRYEDCLPDLPAKEYIWYEGHALDSVDWNRMRPLDEEVIESMRHAEAMFLNFLTRAERKRAISYQERKREYLQCLRYWNHIFMEKEIDLFISNDIPHFGFDYIPYMFCKQRGIPMFLFSNMRLVRDALFLMDDWENPTPKLKEVYERLKKEHPKGDVTLLPRYEEYFRSQTEKSIDPTPWHMVGKKAFAASKPPSLLMSSRIAPSKGPTLKDLLLFIPRRLTFSYWQSHLLQRLRDREKRRTFAFYDAHTVIPDLTKKYVYVAFHMQPECTTAPQAGAYVDQQLIVEMLNEFLPNDVLLYVKEHPDQGKRSFDGGCRSIAMYKGLLGCNKVRLIPRTFRTFDLMENAVAIATATGSPGFEALFRGKPVFMFGHRFYQDAPGVFHIHSTEDCRRAVKAIFVDGVKPTLPELRCFLKAIEEITIPAAVNPVDGGESQHPWEELVKIVGGALRESMKEKLGGKFVEGSGMNTKGKVHKMQEL